MKTERPNMKHLKKLGSRGHIHLIMPIIVIAIIGAIGTYLLTRSHADTLTSYSNGTVYIGGEGTALTAKGVIGANAPAVISPLIAEKDFDFSWTGKQYAFSSVSTSMTPWAPSNGQSGNYMRDGHGGAFSVDPLKGNQIIVGDIATASAKEYTDTGFRNLRLLAWSRSPDATGAGQKVLFEETSSNTGLTQVGSLNIDTGTFTTYTASNGIVGNSSSLAPFPLLSLDWSQDGSQIRTAYTFSDGKSDTQINICTYTIASQSSKCQTEHGLANTITCLKWSPDGSQIAYTAGSNVFIANADGSNPVQLASDASTVTSAVAWMPDDLSLLYVAGNTDKPKINKITLATKVISLFNNLANPSNSDPNLYGGSIKATQLAVQPLPTSIVSSDTTAPTFSAVNGLYNYSVWKLDADVTDNVGISHVDVYDGSHLLQTEVGLAPGDQIISGATTIAKNLTLKAYDFNGNVATTSVPIAAPTISGIAKVGYRLTANPGSWKSSTPFTYQWYANSAAISGATAKTFNLTNLQVGKAISVEVTYSQSGYAPSKVKSPWTAVVVRRVR